jgi:hypothetical protein
MNFGMRRGRCVGLEIAGEETWIMDGLAKTEVFEGRAEHVVPVMRATAEAIKCLVE